MMGKEGRKGGREGGRTRREEGREGGRAYLKAVHVEEDVGVVLGVDRDEGVLPVDGGQGPEGGRKGGRRGQK
jgi:hypothetical protein